MCDRDCTGTDRKDDLLSRRMAHVGLNTERLNAHDLGVLNEIRRSCPSCEDPGRCAKDLSANVPEPGWEDWDEYCPNAARLRILAALTMFPA